MTTFRWYLLGILALFGAYVALEYYRPKPLDWSPTLSSKDKIPYGTYALHDVLPQMLGTDSVADVRLPIFNRLLDAEEPRGDRPTNVTYANDSVDVANDESAAALEAAALPLVATRSQYVFINQHFTASQLEARALRRFVARGPRRIHRGRRIFEVRAAAARWPIRWACAPTSPIRRWRGRWTRARVGATRWRCACWGRARRPGRSGSARR
ncbi:MAG: hypothetical protein WKG07_10505 [Hymenobacter sp.]